MEKMIGIVTIYNPDREQVINNINLYAPYLDLLVVWDNSSVCHEDWFFGNNIRYHWTGENTCIAPAMNYVWNIAKDGGYSSFLIMDQDSSWVDFRSYREEIERRMAGGEINVFTPYVNGCDMFDIKSDVHDKRLFINSGTVIPVNIYSSIGPRDEHAFPIDALDHDISYALIENGYKAICLTRYKLNHSIGHPKRVGPFRRYTPDYNAFRTYHMTRSHIICYRKHKAVMSTDEKSYFYKEILIRKFLRIILLESEKYQRMKAFIKGIVSGIRYKIK